MLYQPTLKVKFKKKVTHISELPDWYSKNKYDATKNITDGKWYELLYIRQNFLFALQLINSEKGISKNFQETLSIIRKNPLIDIKSNDHLMDLYGVALHYTPPEHSDSYRCPSIHPTTVHELYYIEHNLTKTKGDAARNYYAETYPSFGKFYQSEHKHHEWFHYPIVQLLNQCNSTNVLFTINLQQPDSMILKQLKKILPDIRKSSKIEDLGEKYRSLSATELTRYSVLPFLDLHIWQVENQIKIIDSILLEAIYPASEKSIDDLKTTKIKALKALDINKLEHFLQKQVLA